ncbi:MAG: hypothetical protein KGI32_02815 [Gammaproteobacteria bacterium]|nr:hypothetical protein [Gammaproteobacteria bacterium]
MSQGTPVAVRARQFVPHFSGIRLLLTSVLAALIGLAAGMTAYILFVVIALITNFTYFHRYSTALPNITVNMLGVWVLIIPAIAGLIVGIMAKYGSSKIRGHGIPEAMEAALTSAVSPSPNPLPLAVCTVLPLASLVVVIVVWPWTAMCESMSCAVVSFVMLTDTLIEQVVWPALQALTTYPVGSVMLSGLFST